ncbi:hypothetical protein BdWA1_001581 [Babesia duncani]|uniref:Uncharacterized protein n=1 Tax=Babesia duncani TaxID=323732 RepID=A0AAD9PK74_9APIC|nr:hypothetical protein BdWA1_001581 [Babesia duncani]
MHLESGIDLIESFSLADLYENVAETIYYEKENEYSDEDVESQEVASLDSKNDPLASLTCVKNETCELHEQRIKALEQQLQLLRQQYASLLVNSCALYNTLTRHICKLDASIKNSNPHDKSAAPAHNHVHAPFYARTDMLKGKTS